MAIVETVSPVNAFFESGAEDVMGFLNEIQLDYREAISFASGRPAEEHFGLDEIFLNYETFLEYAAGRTNSSRQTVLQELGQYNRTKGIINELLTRFLYTDEQIKADPSAVLVTVGAQEAMVITLHTLINHSTDVLLAEDPSYVGISAFAAIAGIETGGVATGSNGIDLDCLEAQIREYAAMGKKVKAVYVIPDFHNPTGSCMPLENRRRLLLLADQFDFYIIEDNAYGAYRYDGERLPAIKALDRNRRVILIYSFSKIVYPSLRLAALVADQEITVAGSKKPLSDLMAKVKGYLTVNTPAITQALLGGMLLRHHCSFKESNKARVATLKERRDAVVCALEEHLGKKEWAQGISWTHPQGGFFITLKVPFEVNRTVLMHCVEKYRVIFCPLSFFYLEAGGQHEIRLAFSNLSINDIKTGIAGLSLFFREKCIPAPSSGQEC